MKLHQRRIVIFIGCVLAASALTSCSAPNTLAVFDQPQSEADTMPAGATPNVRGPRRQHHPTALD